MGQDEEVRAGEVARSLQHEEAGILKKRALDKPSLEIPLNLRGHDGGEVGNKVLAVQA